MKTLFNSILLLTVAFACGKYDRKDFRVEGKKVILNAYEKARLEKNGYKGDGLVFEENGNEADLSSNEKDRKDQLSHLVDSLVSVKGQNSDDGGYDYYKIDKNEYDKDRGLFNKYRYTEKDGEITLYPILIKESIRSNIGSSKKQHFIDYLTVKLSNDEEALNKIKLFEVESDGYHLSWPLSWIGKGAVLALAGIGAFSLITFCTWIAHISNPIYSGSFITWHIVAAIIGFLVFGAGCKFLMDSYEEFRRYSINIYNNKQKLKKLIPSRDVYHV